MTPTQIVEVLQSRGWTAEIVEKSQVEDLVEVNSEGLFKCVDGRLSDHAGMQGPKVLGGVYGIAATRRVLDLEGLTAIVGELGKPWSGIDQHIVGQLVCCSVYEMGHVGGF